MPRINNREIDHSQGHAFLRNGQVFYSPNSSRRIIIPDRPGPSSRYRFHQKDALWERFHDPQRWTQEYCFLNFVPLKDGSLREILSFATGPDSDGRFYLHKDKAAEWTQLQDWLFYISALLEQTIDTYPSLKPILPSSLGFQNVSCPYVRHAFKLPSPEIDLLFGWGYYHSRLPPFRIGLVC
jgi:hypothetical protein